jgi:hypothetical protein
MVESGEYCCWCSAYCFVVTESKLAHADNVQHLKSKQSAS